MYKRILVAADGSDTSNLALQEATKLAKDHHAVLRLLHVVDLTMAYSAVEAPYVLEYRKVMEAAGQKVVAERRWSVRQELNSIQNASSCSAHTFMKRSRRKRQPGPPTSL
jgi:nucleotide-binding universal stress UspA family protein